MSERDYYEKFPNSDEVTANGLRDRLQAGGSWTQRVRRLEAWANEQADAPEPEVTEEPVAAEPPPDPPTEPEGTETVDPAAG